MRILRLLRHANPFVRASRSAEELAHASVPRHGRFWFPRLLLSEWRRIDISALASQVAYSLIFAIPSLMLFMMAMAAIVDQRTGVPVARWLRDAIDEYAPSAIKELLVSIVDEAVSRAGSGFASLSAAIAILIAIWGASSGINTLMNACNRAYGVPDTRSFVAKRVLSLLLTGVFAIFAVTTAVLFIGGQKLEHAVFQRLDLSPTYREWWGLMRWPVIVLPIASALLLLYSLGSIARPPLRWTVPGARFSAGGWLVLLWGFRYILSIIRPGSPYGATGSVLVMLFFLHATGMVFIIGAAFNGLLVRFFRPRS